jgi:hypothetical protein
MLMRNAESDIAATTNPKILEKNENALVLILIATKNAVKV